MVSTIQVIDYHLFELLLVIRKIVDKLFPTCVARNMRIINVNELYSSDALELNQFSDWLSSQIELCKSILLEKWIPSVFKIVSHVRIIYKLSSRCGR